MDLAAFNDVIDRYGADPAKWPPHLSDAGLGLLDRSAEARAAQAELLSIESIFRPDRGTLTFDPALASRAMRHPQRRPFAGAWRRAAFVAVAAAALLLGVAVGQVKDRNDPADHMLASSFDNGEVVDVD